VAEGGGREIFASPKFSSCLRPWIFPAVGLQGVGYLGCKGVGYLGRRCKGYLDRNGQNVFGPQVHRVFGPQEAG